MSEFNKQEMTEIADEIIDILKFCLANKNIWKSDKQRMLTMIKDHNETFYERYPRICRIMVNSDNIIDTSDEIIAYNDDIVDLSNI